MNTEQESNPEPGLPVEQLFSDRYRSILETARNVIEQLRGIATHQGKYLVCSTQEFEAFCAQQGKAIDYAAFLEGMGAIQLNGETVRIKPDLHMEGTWAQAFLVEYLRNQPNTEFTAKLWDQYQNTLDTVLDSSDVPNNAAVLPPGRRDIFVLAAQAGLLIPKPDDQTRLTGHPLAHTLKPSQKRAVLMTTELMKRSRSIAGVTEGWNKLVIDPAQADQLGAKPTPWLKPSALIDADGVQRVMLLSATSLTKRSPKVVKEWRFAKEEQSEVRDRVLLALLNSYESALTLQSAQLPEGIRLQTVAKLKADLAKEGIEHLRSPRQLGHIVPAYVTLPESNFAAANAYRVQANDQAERNACYFVSLSKQRMDEWLASPEYEAWLAKDQLAQEWKSRWETELKKHIIEQATFLPPEVQPVYLVKRSGVEAAQMIINRSRDGNLMLAQRAREPGPEDLWLYFPEAKQYHRYRKLLDSKLTDNQVLDQQAIQMIDWRMQQLVELVLWNKDNVITTDDGETLYSVTFEELEKMLNGFPPLTTTNLRNRQYVLDAQSYRARTGKGRLFICPKGKAQLERVSQGAWYQTLIKKRGE